MPTFIDGLLLYLIQAPACPFYSSTVYCRPMMYVASSSCADTQWGSSPLAEGQRWSERERNRKREKHRQREEDTEGEREGCELSMSEVTAPCETVE